MHLYVLRVLAQLTDTGISGEAGIKRLQASVVSETTNDPGSNVLTTLPAINTAEPFAFWSLLWLYGE